MGYPYAFSNWQAVPLAHASLCVAGWLGWQKSGTWFNHKREACLMFQQVGLWMIEVNPFYHSKSTPWFFHGRPILEKSLSQKLISSQLFHCIPEAVEDIPQAFTCFSEMVGICVSEVENWNLFTSLPSFKTKDLDFTGMNDIPAIQSRLIIIGKPGLCWMLLVVHPGPNYPGLTTSEHRNN